ncbi:BglG family transcription antiterminator [Salinibacillus xinjiangensis]|uniref:PRD domain-containing protein n=1 Tax=Salinibacillus xinjiangensis TaxID=1229268 RepID=A0A6G1X4Z5_9BACI|nr:PRD domain-containing protein [Salinibacillus xinjiangensis]MRG86073.1 PRD domain-containing protein [Salinibacillus xinjiangensis]
MFITSREKSIIYLVAKTSGKHTPQSLASYLNVSVRTVQRDLKAVEKILNQFDLILQRTTNDGLVIEGKNEDMFKLIQQLSNVHPTDDTPEEKKLQLLIKLFHEGSSFKAQVLAKELVVSSTTLATYLDDLTTWLKKFSVAVTRKRGVGIEVHGDEANKRKALASYFLYHFHEDLLENLYALHQGSEIKAPILGFFPSHYLLKVDEFVQDILTHGETKLADHDYLGLIVHICTTIRRSESGFHLGDEVEQDGDQSKEFELMNHLRARLQSDLSIPLSTNDIHYLAVVLKGSKLQDELEIDYDSILLGQKIKNVIEQVSSQIHVDLSEDFSLFKGLLAHMEPSIYRLKHQMGLFNPLTEDIKQKYPLLFMAVRKSLEYEFTDMTFPDDEVAFIVLHFGSALLMNEEKADIHAVIVCPTGIGTSKMLASRIQKEITEISSVDISSIKDFDRNKLNQFDVVISTVRLPFNEIDYILVTPLLSDDDIDMIRSFLQNNLENITRKQQYGEWRKNEEAPTRNEKSTLQDVLKEMKDVQTSMEAILEHFRVERKSNVENHVQVLQEMVEELQKEQLITDSAQVLQKLMDREKVGGLGIPNTNMGLYHCRDDSIESLVFQVSHLDDTFSIKGMDGQEVQMKNLLLMLSPEDLSLREQEILSLISTSLIENDIAMMIFSSSNEAMIRGKLENIFLEYLQNKWIKE